MNEAILKSIIVFACAIFLSGCISPINTNPVATGTGVPELSSTPTAAATTGPTDRPTATATVNPTTTGTPVPNYEAIPATGPTAAPIYTVSCTFAPLILNGTRTVITDISGNITNVDTGERISGSINADAYQFSPVAPGSYGLEVDVQYTVYYSNNSTGDRNTRITDSFGVNGNVDKIYPLY